MPGTYAQFCRSDSSTRPGSVGWRLGTWRNLLGCTVFGVLKPPDSNNIRLIRQGRSARRHRRLQQTVSSADREKLRPGEGQS
jgi:hypothetical protein